MVVPVAGDPLSPRPSGILSYASGLGRYLADSGIEVEFLAAGPHSSNGVMKVVGIMESARSELAFVLQLRQYLKHQDGGPETVIVANSELHAWAFHGLPKLGPVVLVAHGPMFPTLRLRRPISAFVFRWLVEPKAVETAAQIVAIDRDTESYFSRRYPGSRISRIATGIDLAHFNPLDRVLSKTKWEVNEAPVLLFVGRFAPEKRVNLVLETFRHVLASLPETVLLLAGTGPTEKALRQQAAKLSTNRLRFLGPISRSELPSLYSAADAVILTSAIEQSSTVAIEALSCGTPVFSTPVGDCAEILSDQTLGLILTGSPQEMAAKICMRFPENGLERAKYETNRRNAAASRSWDRVGPSIVEVLDVVLSSH